MVDPDASEQRAWTRAREGLKAEISSTAMRLFLACGYDATTVDDIAAEVGISRRSLFRYFGTKEDIVLGGLVEQGRAILAALEARPENESPRDALTAALVIATPDVPREVMLAQARMYIETPALRTSHLAKQLEWQLLLAPELARRLGGPGARNELKANAILGSVLACLHAATEAWVRRGGEGELAELYLEAAAAVQG